MQLTRKDFLFSMPGLAAGTGAAACGDDTGGSGGAGGSGTTGATSGTNGTTATGGTPSAGSGGGDACGAEIAANHGHALVVSQADVDAAADKTYDIKGSSPHTHSVTVTAANFATLASGSGVTITTTEANAHTHSITVTCA